MMCHMRVSSDVIDGVWCICLLIVDLPSSASMQTESMTTDVVVILSIPSMCIVL